MANEDLKDLDETRRLLYMALCVRRTSKYELAGTIVNALLHHSDLIYDLIEGDVDPKDVVDLVISAIQGDQAACGWVWETINLATSRMLEAIDESQTPA